MLEPDARGKSRHRRRLMRSVIDGLPGCHRINNNMLGVAGASARPAHRALAAIQDPAAWRAIPEFVSSPAPITTEVVH